MANALVTIANKSSYSQTEHWIQIKTSEIHIIAFLIYASFATKRIKVDFSLDTHSPGLINLDHMYIARLNEVK